MRRWEKVSSANAEAALLPRIVWATRLSLRGLVRKPRRQACASVSSRRRGAAGLPICSASPRPLVAGVAVEGPGRSKLSELVPDHVLGHEHRNEFVAIIDAEGEPDELGKNGGSARPGPDDLVASRTARFLRFFQQIPIDKRPLPNRACHPSSPFTAGDDAGRSAGRSPWCVGSSCPWSACPMG